MVTTMNNILNNRIYIFLEKLSNIFILNLIWVIACIPIVTIFPATAAMHSVIRQWKIKGETTVLKPFIKQFKLNFKQSFLVGLLWIPFAVLLYVDYIFVIQTQSGLRLALLIPLFLIALLFTFMSAFLFPVMVHYNLRIRDVLKNTFIISLAYFPTTLLVLIASVALFFVFLIIPPLALFIFAFIAFVNYSLCHRCFEKIERLFEDSSAISEEQEAVQ